jgi:hypothetical protein
MDVRGRVLAWFRPPLYDLAPPPNRYADIESRGLLRKRGKIRNVFGQIAAFVFERLIRFERRSLILVEPINLLADPDELLGSHSQTPKQADRIGSSWVSVLIGGFGFGMAMVKLDVLVSIASWRKRSAARIWLAITSILNT